MQKNREALERLVIQQEKTTEGIIELRMSQKYPWSQEDEETKKKED